MPRIRSIKPDVAKHEGIFDAEQETGLPIRFAWSVLPCFCDREGRFQWRTRRLSAEILPYDDDADMARVLDALLTRGFVAKYRVGDAWYGFVPTFRKHQVINNRESDSDIPPISEGDEIIYQGNHELPNAKVTRGSRDDDASTTREVHAQAERKGREGKGLKEDSPNGESGSPLGDPPADPGGGPLELNGSGPAADRTPYQDIIDLYRSCCASLPDVIKLTPARKQAIRARCKSELPTLADWEKFFKVVEMSDFLTGRTEPSGGRSKSFLADLDFLIKQGNCVKVMEGKYDD